MARSGKDEGRTDREPRALGEVLRRMRAAGPLGPGMALGHLHRSWPEVAGDPLAAHTSPAAIRSGVLVIRADGAGWAARARFAAAEVRERAERLVGEGVIREVKVVVGGP